MSWYYNYYLGFVKDGKIYPLGPYDYKQKLYPVFSRSAGFASDLHNEFYRVPEEYVSDELRKQFEYDNYLGEKTISVKMLEFNKLPKGEYIKSGYYLIDDVEEYHKTQDCWDLFYERLDPLVYADKFKNEAILGLPKPKKDCEGEEFEVYSCADYMYFCYPDYRSKEYEVALLKLQLEVLRDLDIKDYVVLMTEG